METRGTFPIGGNDLTKIVLEENRCPIREMEKERIEERLGGMKAEGSCKETRGTIVSFIASGS